MSTYHNFHDLVYHYYRRVFFIFVPGICNAKCSYCYIKPEYSNHAILNDPMIGRMEEFVNKAKHLGFDEFRITGGEPLLFENISDLLTIFKNNNVSYTLLSNGMDIHKHLELFENNRPKKITISYHSKEYHNSIFGVPYKTDLLDENIRFLCEKKIDLTVSILLLENNQSGIPHHVLHLKSLGVNSIKLIYPNNEKTKMNLKNEFVRTVDLLASIPGINVRYSDLNSRTCSMVGRGFLSFSASQNKVYACCNSILNENFTSDIDPLNNLTDTLWNFYNAAQVLKGFPCENHVDFCPIALNDVPVPINTHPLTTP